MRRYAEVFFVAILVGVIFLLPHILVPVLRADGKYDLFQAGVSAYSLDITAMAANTRDVFDGHLIASDSQLAENKGRLYAVIPWIPYFVGGYVARLAGSLQNAYIFMDFLFPAITFLLSFALFYRHTKSKLAGLAAGTGIIFAVNSLAFFPPLKMKLLAGLFHNFLPSDVGRVIFYAGRFPFIEFALPVLLLGMLILYKTLKGKSIHYAAALGIVLGLMAYTYIFYFIAFGAAVTALFLHSLRKRDLQLTKLLSVSLLVAFIISLPYTANILWQPSKDIIELNGVEYGRFLYYNSVATLRFLVLAAVPWLLIRKRHELFYVLSAVFLGALAGMNMQIVTGFNIQSGHWEIALLQQAAVLLWVLLAYEIYAKNCKEKIFRVNLNPAFIWLRRHGKTLATAFVIILLFRGFYAQYAYAANTHDNFALPEDYRQAFAWLNANTEKDSVVLTASTSTNHFIPVYTHNNVFIPYTLYTLANQSEVVDRMITGYKILGMPEEELSVLLNSEGAFSDAITRAERGEDVGLITIERSLWINYIFHFYFIFSKLYMPEQYTYPETALAAIARGDSSYTVPLNVREEILDDYNSTDADLSKYRLDYVMMTYYERVIGAEPKGFEEVFSSGNITIYSAARNIVMQERS